ncbi:hypothetical protein RBG61_10590 [Paludicola sp. MB14-C6]|uniref:hypothetical protein n=1 Tax=Paludihabitans sp. MB14-C6 TaxID=3070656 RepID=UPI0027DB8B4B|nr:hypothetical protein [Paludicola sp. MB14-C6]WMJ22429.1 hypothetical protein RBG61_10590 [Paludicola sp. MB14-C6]
MKKINHCKYGALSVLLLLLAFLWSVTINDICLGDIVVRFIGLNAWSNITTGYHYTIIYSLFFIIPAFILAEKGDNHLFLKAIQFCSIILWIVILLFILLCYVTLFIE